MLKMPFGKKTISTDRPAFVMGIVNLTPDSFFDKSRGGVERALKLLEEGADIIDLGGESTRPGYTPVEEEEELSRVIPLLRQLRKETDAVISIDTVKPLVIKAALEEGADIINNVHSFEEDSGSLKLIKEYKASLVLMHHTSGNLQQIADYLKEKAEFCQTFGIEKEKIIIDPGIGFGKGFEENLTAIKGSSELAALGYPLLMALSRKSCIGQMTDRPIEKRLSGTLTADIISVQKGAKIIRVHDVLEAIDSLNVMKYFQ